MSPPFERRHGVPGRADPDGESGGNAQHTDHTTEPTDPYAADTRAAYSQAENRLPGTPRSAKAVPGLPRRGLKHAGTHSWSLEERWTLQKFQPVSDVRSSVQV